MAGTSYSIQEIHNLIMGSYGYTFISTTNVYNGKYHAILFLTNTTFSNLTDATRDGDALDSSITFPAGLVIYGTFTSISLASGAIFAYKSAQ